jgi:hypothetical protein
MGLQEFKRSFFEGDGDAFVADLGPGFAFYHATHLEPSSDVEFLRRLIPTAREAMGPEFRWTHELQGEEYGALRWTAVIGGFETEGVDLVKEDADGRLLEIRIHMRPADAVAAWKREIGARMGSAPH